MKTKIHNLSEYALRNKISQIGFRTLFHMYFSNYFENYMPINELEYE